MSVESDDRKSLEDRVQEELADSLDEELELELGDDLLPRLPEHVQVSDVPRPEVIDRRLYFTELLRLQRELIKLQDWVVATSLKMVVLFEGRDAAGKGGVIKRVTQRLNPRICRTVALAAPTERERSQWYFQRYVAHLPAAGEIVLFDRSWYNRAGVERVMGFCTRRRSRGVLPHRAGVRAHAGALGHHPGQILVLDHRSRAEPAFPDAHPRSAEAVEALAHGPRIAAPLGGIHQGQGGDAGAHPHPGSALVGRRRRQQASARRGSTASTTAAAGALRARSTHQPIVLPAREHKPDYHRTPVPDALYVPAVY